MIKTLIYGGGTIGSFLALCLEEKNRKIFFLCRNNHYKAIKKKGLKINLFQNSKFKKKFHLNENKRFEVLNNLNQCNEKKFDEIFITTTINEDINKILIKIKKYVFNNTIISPPCTNIPFWWYLCLKKNKKKIFEKKLHKILLSYIQNKNLAGMTMWLSGNLIKPGHIRISHIQRGFPIKEVFNEKKKHVNEIRKKIRKIAKSPNVKNIFSEIFIKSINALAFNMIALKYKQSNSELFLNQKAKKEIEKILNEGDKILRKNGLKIYQKPIDRINQTLSSKKHTMSMLTAFKENRKIELKPLWSSFKELSKNLKIKMPFTEKIFKSLKLNDNF